MHQINNKEINLTTTVKSVDETEIINDFNKLNIISTKILIELNNPTSGIFATLETDANTKLDIVKSEFDSIIIYLDEITSD